MSDLMDLTDTHVSGAQPLLGITARSALSACRIFPDLPPAIHELAERELSEAHAAAREMATHLRGLDDWGYGQDARDARASVGEAEKPLDRRRGLLKDETA
jgi:hypothetical protein